MKVIKPLKLGVLHRTFEHRGGCFLAASVLVFFRLDAPRSLLAEAAMWKLASKELGKDAALDGSMPKLRGEFLVAGAACAPRGAPRPVVPVRVKLGALDKRLVAVGDRFFRPGLFGGPSAPQPFAEMPITWERAFGGEGYARNPLGKGCAPVKVEHGELQLLPNIEDPNHPVTSPDDRPAPAGFGPYDMTWPQRASKAGTYDAKWLEERFPGLPDDIDWSFFNVAPEDQQARAAFQGGEAFVIENMHPDKPLIEGRLPDVVGRCFITRKTDKGEQFTEIPMQLDTVWFFPNAERGVLVLHGRTAIREHDGADVLHLVAACEDPASPRPVAHYQEVLARRLDREKGALHALRDGDLMPGWPADGAALFPEEDVEALRGQEDLLRKHARRKAEEEIKARRAWVQSLGLDPDEHGPLPLPPEEPAPDLENLPELVERMLAEGKALEQKEKQLHAQREVALRRLFEENGLDFAMIEQERQAATGGPPTFTARGKLDQLRKIAEQSRASGVVIDEIEEMLVDPALLRQYQDAERRMREGYLAAAHQSPPASAPEEADALRLRAVIVAAHAEGESLENTDFTGANLADLDLRGIDFRGAFLEGARFAGADLRGADFSGAVLTRADFTRARISGAKLAGANLGKAVLKAALAGEGTDFTGAILSGADLSGADLRGATLAKAELSEATLLGADLSGAKAMSMTFLKNKLGGVRFAGADLTRTNFLEVELDGVDFTGAVLESAAFLGASGKGVLFRGARLRNARIVLGCRFERVDFKDAVLDDANLRGSALPEGDFQGASLDRADLSECDLQRAKLTRVSAREARFVRANLAEAAMSAMDLMNGILQCADLRGADLRDANLFEADISRIVYDGRTSLKNANLKRACTRPIRKMS